MRTSSLLAFLLALLLVSCENNPLGTLDTQGTAPFLEAAVVLPKGFDLDTKIPSGGTYQLVATLTATVIDADGASDIASVTYALYGPDGSAAITSGELTKTTPSVDNLPVSCTGTLAFQVARSAAGMYRLVIQAADRSGHRSPAFVQELPVYTGRSAPVLSRPGARVLAQSGTDSTLYALTVSALDSNGLADVAQVHVRTIGVKNPVTLQMYDDGLKAHADVVAGDGIYSLPAWIAPAGDMLEVAFEFSASDRSGHASNIIRRPIVNDVPRFISLNVPTTIQRPTTGSTLITFSVTVADGNGLSDIDSVCFRNMSSATPVPFLLYDDGQIAAHGDTVANDGTYASILQITSTNTLGAKLFRFSVSDLMGARSDSTITITIN